jgi:hypothetical protein
MRRIIWQVAALALVVALPTGCKKKAPPAPAAVEPAPAPPPVAMAAVDLGRAIGADKKVTAATTVFGVRDTIYASVSTTGVASSAVLTAKWTFQTGQLVDSTSQSIAPTGPATTEFHIAKASAWPAGKYKVAVSLNGGAPIEKEFEVKK